MKYRFHGANWSYPKGPCRAVRFAEKELAWIAEIDPPGRAAAEAYLLTHIAQAAWISGRYSDAVRPARRARRLDPSVLTSKTATKYAAALLPPSLVAAARRCTRPLRGSAEPDPWLDLPTPLPA